MTATRPRIVVVDDHRLFRSGVRAELGHSVEVVGEAADVESAVAVVQASQARRRLQDHQRPRPGGRDPAGSRWGRRLLAAARGVRAGRLRRGGDAGRDDRGPELDALTPREREVLRLIARGYTYREIGRQLFISVKTVETHVSAVLRKLQLSNRHQLTRWASDRRLI